MDTFFFLLLDCCIYNCQDSRVVVQAWQEKKINGRELRMPVNNSRINNSRILLPHVPCWAVTFVPFEL